MKQYNYADEIIKEDNWLPQNKYRNNYKPKENILNDEDQNMPVNTTDKTGDKNEPEDKIKAFEEGIRNDSTNTEENMDGVEE